MSVFKPSLITLALVTVGLTPMVHAEQKTEEQRDIEILEVKGFQRSVVKSLDTKRYADTVVETISADDLGALPDQSIADALTRLPGVTAVRTGGQASGLNIRGMDGDFVFATLNGREQVTTGGKRSIEFDQYPSELISQAQVYKSQKASLIEGGVAGSVELQTANPLDNAKEHSFNINTRGSFNDRADEVTGADEFGKRLSLSYQGKFLDETLGVAVGYAHMAQPHVATQYIGLNYNGGNTDISGRQLDGTLSEGMEIQQKGGNENRDGYMAAIVFQPNDNWQIKGDLFHSKFDSHNFARGYRIKNLNGGVVENEIVEGDSIIGGDISTGHREDGSRGNFGVFVINDNDSKFSETTSAALNIEWNDGDRWVVAADISISKADGKYVNGGTRARIYDDFDSQQAGLAHESISYLNDGLNIGSVEFGGADRYSSHNHLGLTQVGIWPYDQQNDLESYKLDASYALDNGFISTVEFGARYADRQHDAQRSIANWGDEWGSNVDPIQVTEDMGTRTAFGGELAGMPDFIAIDFDQAIAAIEATGHDMTPTANWRNDWTMVQSGGVNEKTLAAYAQANLDFDLAGIPVTGNIGARVVNTKQSSTGMQNMGSGEGENLVDGEGVVDPNNAFKRIEVGQEFTDFLPSLNLNFHITDNDQIRFSAAKVMSRAPINKLKAGMGSWYSFDCDAAKADSNKICYNAWGNTSPLLKPFYADQYDLSFEHYFDGNNGAIVAALFYKNIQSFIEDYTIKNYDFEGNGIALPDTRIHDDGKEYEVVGGDYQTAVNNTNKGGYIRGIELAYTQVFDFLPQGLDGLGFTGSYSYSDSDITSSSPSGLSQTFPGLSAHVFNATVFYQYGGFDTRVSSRYRSEYVSEQMAVESQLAYFAPETIVDYQASYSFDNGLKALFQINNLLDTPSKTYFGEEHRTGTIQNFGRQMFLGMSYGF